MESSISTEIKLLSRHFSNNGISKSTPNYTSKNRNINFFLDDIDTIIGELSEQGLEPNTSFVKKQFLERKENKKIITPTIKSFRICFDEFYMSKKHNSKGYVKPFSL